MTTRRLYDAREVCHDFWHDLAAPILAGIITAAIVGWWRNRK
ncbi:type I toxin-antitoxin system toxin Ldr family protein [Escherichia coli]|nr:type I toxin-antitoxin system toxin Ldr family protein [Escherichia coli]